jgi:hypothetical protein
MSARVFFLCAQGSSRALLAASLLQAQDATTWEVWATPSQDERGEILARQVLREQDIAPLSAERLLQPTFGMRWEEGIVLCSGGTNT